MRWLKRIGLAGVVFFTVKGLIWLGVALMALVLVVTLAGCSSSLRKHAYDWHQKVAFKVGDKWVIAPPRELTAAAFF